LFALGLLFVLVTLFLPRGVMGLFTRLRPVRKPTSATAVQTRTAP
jgi:hypothetical protein